MPDKTTTRKQLIDNLNEDLSREYQAIIAYVVYSQALKGPQYMSIAKELEDVKQKLASAGRTREAEADLRAGRWHGWGIMQYLGRDVHVQRRQLEVGMGCRDGGAEAPRSGEPRRRRWA